MAEENGRCSFRDCKLGKLEQAMARVEVQTVVPEKEFKKLHSQFKVSWRKSGSAEFHFDCWNALLKSARCRNKKYQQVDLINTEKAMIKEAAKTCERHDSIDTLKEEAKRIAELIKKSKYCCCFTGAGISTSAGIGDYRGKSGKWTEMDREDLDMDSLAKTEKILERCDSLSSPKIKRRRLSSVETPTGSQETQDEDSDGGVPYEDLRPTYTHEALAKLMEMGILKYVISQNGDGLHTLSGIPQDSISELHGNVFQEKCEKCNTRYDRTFYTMDDVGSQYFEELEDDGTTDIEKPKHAVKCKTCGLSHRTGRKCEKKGCNGMLMDTIINFRDNLEEEILDRAYKEGKKCDLMLCLGTTLTVTPANSIVEMGKEPLHLVIVNRQTTHMDKECLEKDEDGKCLGSRIFGDCDEVMKLVMKHLLSKQDLTKWESGRDERMKQYDKKRTT